MANLALPGNPRYQPKDLVAHFGYDNLARKLIEVEFATLQTLGDIGAIKPEDIALLTPEVEAKLLSITMSEVDKVEREITKHDIRALVRLMQDAMPAPLRRWVHVPLTSYDVIDTARAMQFSDAYVNVVRPKVTAVVKDMRAQALKHADRVQIGRTHGQHALPITVGFWFSTILNRLVYNAKKMDEGVKGLVGKISGAVGAYNAQSALGFPPTFEKRVLEKLGLKPAPISTQIVPPEPLAYFLHACVMVSATLGQFGRDARHLMRTEIAELAEPFEKGQVGSSTMAHKRNPLHFENLEGTWLKTKSEFGKVLDTLVSEHQRDLVGSSLARDFPTILVNLTYQLDTLLRPGKDGNSFLSRITVDVEGCQRNLGRQGDTILAEPFYLALQMAGYEGDAHEVINHRAMPLLQSGQYGSLFGAMIKLCFDDPEIDRAWSSIPREIRMALQVPASYIGRAKERVVDVCSVATAFLDAPLEDLR